MDISNNTGAKVIRKNGEVFITEGTEEAREQARIEIKAKVVSKWVSWISLHCYRCEKIFFWRQRTLARPPAHTASGSGGEKTKFGTGRESQICTLRLSKVSQSTGNLPLKPVFDLRNKLLKINVKGFALAWLCFLVMHQDQSSLRLIKILTREFMHKNVPNIWKWETVSKNFGNA